MLPKYVIPFRLSVCLDVCCTQATSQTIDFAYGDRYYRSVFCLSVTFVHCAQTAEDMDAISFAYDSTVYLPEFGLYQPTPAPK